MKVKLKTVAFWGRCLVTAALAASGGARAEPSNKQLTIGTSQEFESLNPLIAQMSASRYIYQMAQRPLVAINNDWQWQCYLCVKYPTLDNGGAKLVDDGKGKKKILVSWEIRPDAKWGDGKAVTGEDFKLAWEIGKDPGVSVGSKDTYDIIETVAIDKANPKKFTTLIKEARFDYNQLPINLVPSAIEGPIFAKAKGQTGSYEKLTAYTTDPTNVGLYNGPYILKELKLGSHAILERNPTWGGPAPAIERLIVKYIPNTQTLEANLQSGTIDFVNEIGMTLDQALAFDKRIAREPALKARFKVSYTDGLIYEHIDLNQDNPVLADVNVRKALVYAIDRDGLTKALFEGKQKKALSFIHPKDVHFSEDVVKYDYSPAKAAELLAKAGWKKSASGIFEKDGKKLALVIQTTAGNKSRELVEVFIQEQLKKAGVEVTIQNEPARVFFGETMTHRKFPAMAMYAWTSSPDIPHRTELFSTEIPTEKNGWSGQNFMGWKNAKVDERINAFLGEFDVTKRKALMLDIQKAYTDEVPVIPLYMRSEIVIIPTKLAGFRVAGHQYYSTLEVENWKIESTGAH